MNRGSFVCLPSGGLLLCFFSCAFFCWSSIFFFSFLFPFLLSPKFISDACRIGYGQYDNTCVILLYCSEQHYSILTDRYDTEHSQSQSNPFLLRI